jgi:hypothetical protein
LSGTRGPGESGDGAEGQGAKAGRKNLTSSPSSFLACRAGPTLDEEIRAIDEELADAEPDKEVRAFFESLEGLSLDEKIRALEDELEQEGD